jgi:hypothetical protein
MQLPVGIKGIILISVTIITVLTIVDLVVAPGSISKVINLVSIWVMVYGLTFVLVVNFGLGKNVPVSLRLRLLFSGIVLFFAGVALFSRNIALFGIDFGELFLWCALVSFLFGKIFLIIFLVRYTRTKKQTG